MKEIFLLHKTSAKHNSLTKEAALHDVVGSVESVLAKMKYTLVFFQDLERVIK